MLPYKPEIDGLRAISILGVVLYHAACPVTPGGFVGVDVFFVISGYLITRLLIGELINTGRIDLLAFWARRVRRLLPSAFVVIAASAAFAVFVLPPHDLRTAGHDLTAASAYFVNWRLALRSVDYLAEGERHSLFLHFWSLSVEEQFYLIWPTTLVLLGLMMPATEWTRRASALPALSVLVIAAGLGSFLANLYLTSHSQPFAFFGTASRAWQLLAGSLIATIPKFGAGSAARRALSWGGTVLIVLAVFFYSQQTAYPGIAAVAPVAGAAMVILSAHGEGAAPGLGSWLGSRGMVYVGQVSYVWYLWHWPVLLLGDLLVGGATWLERTGMVGISFALAAVTHALVEQPFRFAPILALSTARSMAMGALVTAASIGIGFGLASVRGAETFAVPGGLVVIDPQSVRNDIPRPYRDGCHLDRVTKDIPPCAYGDPDGKRTAILFGDSHATQWFPPIEAAARSRGWRLLSRTRTSCPAMDIRTWALHANREYSECSEWRTAVLTEIGKLNPNLIILASTSDYDPVADRHGRLLRGEARLEALRDGETRLVEALRSVSSARVVLIRDTPRLPQDPLDCLFLWKAASERCVWPRLSVYRQNTFPFASHGASGPISTLDLSDRICGPEACPALKDGLLVMRDRHHLTAAYAATFAMTFEQVLRESE